MFFVNSLNVDPCFLLFAGTSALAVRPKSIAISNV